MADVEQRGATGHAKALHSERAARSMVGAEVQMNTVGFLGVAGRSLELVGSRLIVMDIDAID